MINCDSMFRWIYFEELDTKSGAMTFLRENSEHIMIPMIKFPIEIIDEKRDANFNCINLITGNVEYCPIKEKILPVDFDLSLKEWGK